MIKRIYPLPSSLTNQIAAGEVIERPASVVKELLENALDAKATNILINIEGGGVQCIEISDDGMGIHPEDLPLAVLSHATSKIRTLDDLFSVQSLGFRGEALASISAVSRFSMISKIADNIQGYELIFDEIKHTINISPRACNQGTTICVRDLFFNTPVRRKFLSSEKTEWLQIEQVIKRIALSRFDVTFQLKYKNTLHLPAVFNDTGIEMRIRKIFGSTFLEQSVKIDIERGGLRLWGWAGLPSFMRSQNDLQYFYLNGRMIRDKLVNHAIRSAYEGTLYSGRQPVFLLYLEMLPELVDVNVHPTKHEVKFCEPRQVHDFIQQQLINIIHGQPVELEKKASNIINAQPTISKIQEASAVYETVVPDSFSISEVPCKNKKIQWLEFPYCLIQFQEKFLLCHYIRLYQSLCQQHFLEEIAKNRVVSRPLLVPMRLSVSPYLLNNILVHLSQWERLGLSLNSLDEKTLCIRAFPARTPYLNFTQWLESLENLFEKKQSNFLSELSFIHTLINANSPVFPVPSQDLSALLADFEHCLLHENMTQAFKQSYRIMTLDDWDTLLFKNKL